tara:strand:- start:4821 stop:5159 length:339 start_codon:yes stop_codon:yes gene_type:complete
MSFVHLVHMSWQDDEQIWDNLDEVMMNAWTDMKNFLDAMSEYNEELGTIEDTILFGGIGQFWASYVESRIETNTPKHSLANALEAVIKNSKVQRLLNNQMMGMFDRKMEGMK